MQIIDEYRTRIHQANTLEQKKALAAELHQLSDSFTESQKAEYEHAMRKLRRDIAYQLEAIEPISQRAEAILSRYALVDKS